MSVTELKCATNAVVTLGKWQDNNKYLVTHKLWQ